MNRKSLPIALVVLALLASTVAFAADAPAVPLSQEELISTLQAQPDAEQKAPELEGSTPEPILQHGSFCSYQGQACRSCVLSSGASGLKSCEIQRCSYNGVWHNHYVNCGNCTTACAN